MLHRPSWRPPSNGGLPLSIYLLYAAGVLNLLLVFINGGWLLGFQAFIGCVMFWTAALMHERYTIR